jgi:pyruvate dehydrogenase E1 component alpha subunit
MTEMSHEAILKMDRYRDLSISGMDAEVVKKLYKFMLRLRRCEEALMKEYHPADEMRCPVHFCIGQEAVPAALSLLLARDDYLFSHHRSHGYFLAKGASMKSLFAELYGRETGANGGKAGSQDISMPSVKFYSGAILTGATAIAVGAGLGFQLKRNSNVAVAGFGEGAADEGIFWEAINYAALRKLPVLFLCENNRYATYSHQLKRHPADNISHRVAAFGVKTCTLFGNDVTAVYLAIDAAIRHVRSGRGPFFIEAYTYRWHGHVGPEDDDYLGYRPESELEFWKTNCPLSLLEEQMIAGELLTPTLKATIIDDIDDEIADAFKFAKNSPFPNDTNWERLNYNLDSPLADKLLSETKPGEFNQDQADTTPRPY